MMLPRHVSEILLQMHIEKIKLNKKEVFENVNLRNGALVTCYKIANSAIARIIFSKLYYTLDFVQ